MSNKRRGKSIELVDNIELGSPVWFAIVHGDFKHAQRLIESGVDFPNQIRVKGSQKDDPILEVNPLHVIALLGEKVENLKEQEEFAKFLIERGIDVNVLDSEGYSALYYAVLHNCYGLVELLLENGARVEGPEWKYLSALCLGTCVNYRLAPLLIRYDAPVGLAGGSLNRTALHWMMCEDDVTEDKLDIIRNLLDLGESPDEQDEKMESPLHLAVRNNVIEFVKILLEYGAEVNLKNEHGQTPLFIAGFCSSAKVVELLLQNGAKVNELTHNNTTALHVACCYHRHNIMDLLVEYGADVHLVSDIGTTPFSLMIFDIIDVPACKVMIKQFAKLRYEKNIMPNQEDMGIINKHTELKEMYEQAYTTLVSKSHINKLILFSSLLFVVMFTGFIIVGLGLLLFI